MPRQAEDDAGAPTRQLPLPPWGSLVECPCNTGIPGIRPGRRTPGRLVGIVSSLEAKFSEKLFENWPGSTTT